VTKILDRAKYTLSNNFSGNFINFLLFFHFGFLPKSVTSTNQKTTKDGL
jgi:hypothetical protein